MNFKEERVPSEKLVIRYIYGKSGGMYKYLVFTHTPEKGKEEDYEKLKYNIDPQDNHRSSYVKKKYDTARSGLFRSPDKKYRIHEEDKETVKKYKK